MPACRADETVRALSMLLVKTPAARPYCVALARWMTSWMLRKDMICCTGPKIWESTSNWKKKGFVRGEMYHHVWLRVCRCVWEQRTSSLAMRMSSVTLEKTVGWMKSPCWPHADPPHSSVAPSLLPLSMRSIILSNCFWSIYRKQQITAHILFSLYVSSCFQLTC